MTHITIKTGATDDDAPETLIAFLWPRVRNAYAALCEARQSKAVIRPELTLQFRTQALLMASEPARSWEDLEPKVIVQALVRNDLSLVNLHFVQMLDAAIMADHELLNGDRKLN